MIWTTEIYGYFDLTFEPTVVSSHPGVTTTKTAIKHLQKAVAERFGNDFEIVADRDTSIENVCGFYYVYSGNDPDKEGETLHARRVLK